MPVRVSHGKEKFNGKDALGHFAPQAFAGMMDWPIRHHSDH